MKLILAQYLRMLRERNEFDRLLPDLLVAMNYVTLFKPQVGVQQHGVDSAAVGINEDDGQQELLLLVIKCGDISRSDWDSNPQSVRQSLNEILDVFLVSHVDAAYVHLRKRIVLVTTGNMNQNTHQNWNGYVKTNSHRASFDFWNGEKVVTLIEKYMLNENIFNEEDRSHLRKALALAGEIEYDQKDLHLLYLRQLGMKDSGELLAPATPPLDLIKALRAINISGQIFSKWAQDDANLKQAFVASERAILWSWHRIHLEPEAERMRFVNDFTELWYSYNTVALKYFDKVRNHLAVQDGLSGYCREHAEFSLIVFEQIGILASIGLSQIMIDIEDEEIIKIQTENAVMIADALCALLRNNTISGSPCLDIHIIDITLGMMLLVSTRRETQAQEWLAELVKRVDFTYKLKRNFPICTDSIDDLVEATVYDDDDLRAQLMATSWTLPSLAAWSIILRRDEIYSAIARNSKTVYPEICLQLWHPTQDLPRYLYFNTAQNLCGETEAPIILPDSANEYRKRMMSFLEIPRFNILDASTTRSAGIPALDMVACRHFRTPVAPYFWYQFLRVGEASAPAEAPSTTVAK